MAKVKNLVSESANGVSDFSEFEAELNVKTSSGKKKAYDVSELVRAELFRKVSEQAGTDAPTVADFHRFAKNQSAPNEEIPFVSDWWKQIALNVKTNILRDHKENVNVPQATVENAYYSLTDTGHKYWLCTVENTFQKIRDDEDKAARRVEWINSKIADESIEAVTPTQKKQLMDFLRIYSLYLNIRAMF